MLPVPPSSNRYWRRFGTRVVKSEDARAYQRHVEAVTGRVTMFRVPVALDIRWYRARRSGDLSNRIKVLEDALQGIAFENDSQVRRLTMELFDTDRAHPRVEVTVTPYPEAREAA